MKTQTTRTELEKKYTHVTFVKTLENGSTLWFVGEEGMELVTYENLEMYQIKYLIEDRMEELAKIKGVTPKSITRITGWGYDTKLYETLNIILKTVKMDGITKDDMIDMYDRLQNVRVS